MGARFSLRLILSAFISSLLLFVLMLAACFLYWNEKRVLLHKIEENHRTLGISFAQTCGDALILGDELAAVNAVSTVKAGGAVEEAACVDPRGRIVAHSDDRRRDGRYTIPEGARVTTSVPGFEKRRWYNPQRGWLLSETHFVTSGEAVPGRSVIVFSETKLERMVRGSLGEVGRRILIVLSGTLVLGISGAVFLAGRLTRPIQSLADSAHRIGQGDFSPRVNLHASRELEELGQVFNQTAAALGQLDQMKDEFISMVSHDLRSPLNAIQSYAETLRDERRGPLNEKQKQYLSVIFESARSLAMFVSDVLDLAKVRAGRMDYHIEKVALSEVAATVVSLFQALADRQGARLEVGGVEGLYVHADIQKVGRILMNLVSNALKVVPAQTGVVQVTGRIQGNFVRVEVADNGPGMTSEDQARLFQKFVQLTAGPTNQRMRTVGTGLGLTLVKFMVEAQGGVVGVTSDLGKGSVFFFTLPVVP